MFLYVPPALTFKILHGPRFALDVLCQSQNRQRPWLYTALTDWFLQTWWKMLTARYWLIPYIRQITFRLYKILNLNRQPSWSSGQSFWLLIMRSRVWFPVLPWYFFFEGEDSHGDHGLGSLVELRLRPLLVLHIHTSPATSSGQRNCASWVSVTFRPQPGGETTKSIRVMWWHWGKNQTITKKLNDNYLKNKD
jgi:hypothetical protein